MFRRETPLGWLITAAMTCAACLGCHEEQTATPPRQTADAPPISVAKAPPMDSEPDSIPSENESMPPRPIDELLLFFPSKYPEGDWSPAEPRFEDVWFASEDGTKLHGWYCPCESPRAVVLIAHGNAGHLASRAAWLAWLQSRACVTAFIFDYRGYGRSEGSPTVEGALVDARAARAKLRELAGVADSEMTLMGESLGGAIVAQVAAESPPRALVLQSTFSSLRDVASHHFPKLAWLVPPEKLDSASAIARYRGPLLISHGTADGTIPFPQGEKLFAAANEPKTFIAIPGADHNDWLTEEYLARLSEFFASIDE